MSKNRLKSKERKKEILQVTLSIIYNEGFYNLTIRNIARKTDISEAAIYRHFKNKNIIIYGKKLIAPFHLNDAINAIKIGKKT